MSSEYSRQAFTDDAPVQVQQSWLARNLWLLVVPVLILVGLTIGGVASLWSLDLLRAPRDMTMTALKENPKVQQSVGVPFQMAPDAIFAGDSHIDGFDEVFVIEPFTIIGLKGEARVSGKIRRRKRGEWLPDGILVEVPGNPPIRIPDR